MCITDSGFIFTPPPKLILLIRGFGRHCWNAVLTKNTMISKLRLLLNIRDRNTIDVLKFIFDLLLWLPYNILNINFISYNFWLAETWVVFHILVIAPSFQGYCCQHISQNLYFFCNIRLCLEHTSWKNTIYLVLFHVERRVMAFIRCCNNGFILV